MNKKITSELLTSGKIVVLEGKIAHIKGNKKDIIIRLNDELLDGIDGIIELVDMGYGNIREATLKEKEFWFSCHNNLDIEFVVCSINNS